MTSTEKVYIVLEDYFDGQSYGEGLYYSRKFCKVCKTKEEARGYIEDCVLKEYYGAVSECENNEDIFYFDVVEDTEDRIKYTYNVSGYGDIEEETYYIEEHEI